MLLDDKEKKTVDTLNIVSSDDQPNPKQEDDSSVDVIELINDLK